MYDPVVIENAKENVMPLKEGRYLDDLAQVLCEPKEAIHARKIEYETELEHLPESTNVELLVEKWERYIEWIKESYPTDKSLDILVPAYEGCIQELTKLTDSTGELKDLSGSSVTLKLFAGYARLRKPEEQGEVFEFMENRRLCTELPLFYEAAATAYANGKQYDKAFNVLNRGLLRLGSAVEDVYHRFAVKMEENVAQDRVKEEELSHRKAFTDLNRDELSAGFRRPSHRVERGLFTQKIKTTPCKTKPVFIAPDNVPIPEKDNKKICKEDEQKPEEPSKKKLRLIQSKIPEIRKGRAENIPMSERWSKVRIPQAHFLCSGNGSRTGGGGGRSLVTIFNDGAQTTENSKKEAMGYNKLILVSKDGEEQQFEEARMERYLKQIKIKKEESLEASTAQDAVDPYADRTSRTDLFNRLGTCPNIRLNQNESPIPDKSEVPLETIVSFLSEQRSISGNAKTAALYLLDEMLSCVICLRENEAIHGTISTKSFTYTTLLENNKVCERNRTLTDKFWHNRGLVLHGFGAKSIDVSSLCGKSCCGSWPPHLKPFQKSEHWLWDIDLAGVFEVMGKITGTDKEGATQNCSVALKPRTDVLAEFWGLDYERCSLDDLKELRGKIEKNLFGDRRKTVASKAALVWVELNLL